MNNFWKLTHISLSFSNKIIKNISVRGLKPFGRIPMFSWIWPFEHNATYVQSVSFGNRVEIDELNCPKYVSSSLNACRPLVRFLSSYRTMQPIKLYLKPCMSCLTSKLDAKLFESRDYHWKVPIQSRVQLMCSRREKKRHSK